MSGEPYDEDARWLLSDGSIIGKVHRKPDPQGVRLSLPIPLGEPVVAILAKLDASSMTQFCELARNTYHERKADQTSKAERASSRNEERKGRESAERAGAVQDVQEAVEVNPLDAESISRRLVAIGQRVGTLSSELRELDAEGNLLYKILEILNDASTDDEETNGSLQTTTPSPNEGEGAVSTVDCQSCEDQLLQSGEDSVRETDSELGSFPNTQPETSQDGSLQEEADVNADLTKGLDSDTDAL